jgi:hypothetical protein
MRTHKISLQTIDEKGQVVFSNNFEVGDITKSVLLSFNNGYLVGISTQSGVSTQETCGNFRLLRKKRSKKVT